VQGVPVHDKTNLPKSKKNRRTGNVGRFRRSEAVAAHISFQGKEKDWTLVPQAELTFEHFCIFMESLHDSIIQVQSGFHQRFR
jgi:hypothetical protein